MSWQGGRDQRRAGVAGGAARVVRAIGRAVRVEIIRTRADAEKIVGCVALGTGGAVCVELARLLGMSEVAEVSREAVRVERARALPQALALEV